MNAAHDVTAYLITSLQFIVFFPLWWPKKSGQCEVKRIEAEVLAIRIMTVNRTLVLHSPLVGLRLMGQRVVMWLPASIGTVNGKGYQMGLRNDSVVVWRWSRTTENDEASIFFKVALIWCKRAAGARSSMKRLLVKPRASVSSISACPWACEVNSNSYWSDQAGLLPRGQDRPGQLAS